ncbi:uncharacterized protein LOC121367223 [Gigantopelta aegis]|uniref:uncharacterized protein LOC121367223 n=1 Tax=Gigantopelta aegis TaxID=1735272 RepID=UPI001B888A1F|nr:uncharacterized protein LOC121367223 [Gigantopelta aegis]
MESCKPKRKPNWTEDETLSLVRLVDERKDIIRGKFGEGVTRGGPVMNLSGIAEAVYDVLGHSNVSISGVDGGLNSSLIQVIDLGTSVVPQSSTVNTLHLFHHEPPTSNRHLGISSLWDRR